MKKGPALGFITYRPGPNFAARVQDALRAGFPVYLFDNSPEDGVALGAAKARPDGANYATCGRNAGLGVGLASVCARAYYDGVSELLFFDQDTVFTAETLEFVRDFSARNPGLGAGYAAVVFNATRAPMADRGDFRLNDVPLAVNSGSLYFLENLRKIGWHDPRYFVDCVDYEFCMAAHAMGLKIGEYTETPGFDHKTEQADSLHSFFGRPRHMRAYPLSRVLDYVTATARLLLKALRGGQFFYFFRIGRLGAEYLAIQVYVRAALLFGF